MKYHGDHDNEHDGVAEINVAAGESIGTERRHDQVNGCTCYYVYKRITVASCYHRIFQNRLVGFQTKTLWIEQHTTETGPFRSDHLKMRTMFQLQHWAILCPDTQN